MNQLKAMKVFLSVVDAGSFTTAAADLGISRAKVSAHISELERHLGILLLNRTTRSLSLTHDGRTYYAHCQRVLRDVEETELTLKLAQSVPQGRLTIDASSGFSRGVLLPMLKKFLVRYPDISVELCNTGHVWDVATAQSDVLIRVGPIADSSLIARTIYQKPLMTVAAPEYLAQYGPPKRPDDLARHMCLGYLDSISGREVNEWLFCDGAKTRKISIQHKLVMNNGEVYVAAALEGFGIAHGHSFMFDDYIRSGQLTPVLCDWEVMGAPVLAIYHRSKELSLRVRAFVEFAAANSAIAPLASAPVSGAAAS